MATLSVARKLTASFSKRVASRHGGAILPESLKWLWEKEVKKDE